MWLRYLRFLLTSQNEHGLHSPFVFELVTRCFYDKTKYPEYEILENYRKELLEDKRKIEVTDFGAGSRVFKSKEREVAAIARNVGIPQKRAKFLFRLAKYLECRNILELGTSLGIGTAALALNKYSQVTSIEGCPQTAEVARGQLKKFGFENVNLEIGEFEMVLGDIVESGEGKKSGKSRVESGPANYREWRGKGKQQILSKNATNQNQLPTTDNSELRTQNSELTTHNREPQTNFDLIYFDGHHTKEATLKYFELLLPSAHNDSVFVFDDIHWSRGMEEAWEIIKKHPEVRVSIDTFHLGMIFFRREQVKQDFIIRL
ncbi:O-methyltransferase [Salegentibacter flavus]|uniref:Methyltransferase domain-containing protein n=1 Tax=Salegentibacter flavus TaxID=287099 RepID=A0A1I4Y3Z9_9FLAO|nr:class I SAM-dependent methyltransferase [Salegentibacter flavus]SFN32747.1 Methyltransferase domain-containing protein [Salegentibacter flavus]